MLKLETLNPHIVYNIGYTYHRFVYSSLRFFNILAHTLFHIYSQLEYL